MLACLIIILSLIGISGYSAEPRMMPTINYIMNEASSDGDLQILPPLNNNYHVEYDTITDIISALKIILNTNDLTNTPKFKLFDALKLIYDNRSSDQLLNIMAAASKLEMADLAQAAIEVWLEKYSTPAPLLSPVQKNSVGVFVSIPGGIYQIGSPRTEIGRYNDEALHEVKLSPFWIMDAAVTQREYVTRVGDNPSKHKEKKDCPESFEIIKVKGKKIKACTDYPVENVSHYAATRFAELMTSDDPKYTYSLPTEAQLEVAFRGGTITPYVSGESEKYLKDFVWYQHNSYNQSQSVRSKKKNKYKVHRSSVWEWANDWYDQYYFSSQGLDPTGPKFGTERVFRGGSWSSGAAVCRSAFRNFAKPGFQSSDLGFRLTRT